MSSDFEQAKSRVCQSEGAYVTMRPLVSSWEQRKFSDVVDVCSGKDYKHLKEGPIPVYGTGGFMTSVDEALSYDRDAVGIGRKGTIDKPYLLKAPFWTVDTLFYAIPKSDIDLEFVHCSFLNVDWKSKDESTGLPSLSKEAINETIALVPSFNEQSQLGEFFYNLDSLITLHQREPPHTMKEGKKCQSVSMENRFSAITTRNGLAFTKKGPSVMSPWESIGSRSLGSPS